MLNILLLLIYTNAIIVVSGLNLKLSFLYRLYGSLQTQLWGLTRFCKNMTLALLTPNHRFISTLLKMSLQFSKILSRKTVCNFGVAMA